MIWTSQGARKITPEVITRFFRVSNKPLINQTPKRLTFPLKLWPFQQLTDARLAGLGCALMVNSPANLWPP